MKFKTGVRRNQWVKNVVSIGLSSGFMEPLESTSIHLIQANISKLLAYFPDKSFNPLNQKEFNHVAETETQRIRDFLVMHYKLTTRDDSEYWRQCRDMEIPDTLAYKLEHFKEFGRYIPRHMDIFDVDSWLAVMIGQNHTPKYIDPLLLSRGTDATAWLTKMEAAMEEVSGKLTSHAEFISLHCEAPKI